jgi:hypothetical protein
MMMVSVRIPWIILGMMRSDVEGLWADPQPVPPWAWRKKR